MEQLIQALRLPYREMRLKDGAIVRHYVLNNGQILEIVFQGN